MFALNSLVIEIIVMSSVMNADTFRSYYFETEQICRTKMDVLSRKIHSIHVTETRYVLYAFDQNIPDALKLILN